MRNLVALCVLLFAFAKAYSQDITGTWKTADDVTGIVKSHVEIFKKGEKYYGKVVKVLDPNAPQKPLCVNCTGDLKDAPIEGLQIISNLERIGNVYKNGTIIDPENGKVYDCKIWLNDDNPDLLMLRGYVLFLYRTQTWSRLK